MVEREKGGTVVVWTCELKLSCIEMSSINAIKLSRSRQAKVIFFCDKSLFAGLWDEDV